MNNSLLPFSSTLEPLAKQQGYDLTPFVVAEMEFERKFAELSEWVRANAASRHRALVLRTEPVSRLRLSASVDFRGSRLVIDWSGK